MSSRRKAYVVVEMYDTEIDSVRGFWEKERAEAYATEIMRQAKERGDEFEGWEETDRWFWVNSFGDREVGIFPVQIA